MSVNEQDIKKEIAGMRATLESVRASARAGTVIKVLGLVLGFGIVGFFLYATWQYRVKPLQDFKRWEPVLTQRGQQLYDRLQMKTTLPRLGQEVVPVYLEESKKMLEDLNVAEEVSKELQAILQDLQPVLTEQLDRARPRVEGLMKGEMAKAALELEKLVDKKVNEHLAAILAKQETAIQQETGLTETKVQQLVQDLQEAAQDAAQKLIMKRVERNMDHINKINEVLAEVPELPRKMTQDEMVEQLGLALLARVKFELPGPNEVLKPGEVKK